MKSLAELVAAAASANPDAPFGTFSQQDRLAGVLDRALAASEDLKRAGLRPGDLVAVIGTNCASYIVAFIALQLVGAQAALINPAYPDEFLGGMLDDLTPSALMWIARSPGSLGQRRLLQIDATQAWDGRVELLSDIPARPMSQAWGEASGEADIAAYLHTSGTSGNPKFCALSHGYFLRLGRFFADVMSLSRFDVVVNPLPLFHINPMGNSVVGALTGRSGFLSTEKFSVADFWSQIKKHEATVIVLHGPPSSMLKAKTTIDDARGHNVRIGFFCDPAFLAQFDVPIGVGGYGSTEAGGYCHHWKFRADDTNLPPEGAMHMSGQPRHDIDCMIAEDGEIFVRGKHPQTLFSGYSRHGRIEPQLDADGWFHTGDRGRFTSDGNLIFIERSSESIRVNAEYVPIELVEDRLKTVGSLDEFALWRVDSPTRGHEAVVYTTSPSVDLGALRTAVADLPRYMHPTQVRRIAQIPRDAGVGKTQRRLLDKQPVLETLKV